MKRHTLFAGFDKSKWGPIEIAAEYFLLGILWILFSDKIAERLAPNEAVLSQINIYKGSGYFLVTAILLYWLIARNARNIWEANQKYRLLAENASDVIWLLDPVKGRYTYISPSVLKMRGYTAEEVISMPLKEAFTSSDSEHLIALIGKRVSLFQAKGSGTISYTDEIDQSHRDGSVIPTEVTTTYLFNRSNEIEIVGVSREITKRKRTERKLRESEKKYQELLDQASDGIFIADANGQFTIVNEEACRLVGYTKEELLSMNLRDLVAPEDLETTPLRFDELRTGKTLITERKLLHKNESRINCEISAKILTDGRFQSIVRDITERKVTEDALKRSEKRYRSLFENMSNGYARCQMLYDDDDKPNDFLYLDVNKAFKKLTGLQDVIGKRVSEVIPGIRESNPQLLEIYGRVASTGKPDTFEAYIPELGTGTWFSVSAYSSEKGFFVAVFETITERKRAEESLRRSYEQLLSFIDQAPLGIAMFDRDMNYLSTSRRWIHDYGRGYTNLIGLNHYKVHPDIPDYWKEAHQKGLAGESSKNDDDLWIQADGTKNWLRWAITPWKDESGKVGGIIISAEDISERKRAEAAAFKSELRYHRVLDAMMEGCQILDFNWRYVYVNEVVAAQGKHRPAELLNHTMMEMYPGIEQSELFGVLQRCMGDRTSRRMQNQFIFPDGSIGWFELSVQPAEEGIFILSTDITERKRAEVALRQSEQKFSILFEKSAFAASLSRLSDGVIVEVNESFERAFGYARQEAEGRTSLELGINPDSEGRTRILAALKESNSAHDLELALQTKSGETRIYSVNVDIVAIDGQRYILNTARDVTERKQAEEALRNSEIRYRRLFESAKDGILILDADTGMILDVNPFLVKLLGYSHEVFLGKSIWELGFFKDIVANKDNFLELQQKEYIRYEDMPLETANGQRINVEFVSNVYLVDHRKVIQCNIRDITERKQAEEEIRKLNAELEQRVIERTAELSEANTLLQAMMDYIPDHIYFKDSQSRFIRNSRAQAKLMGLNDPEEVVGKSDFDFFPHAQRAFDEEQEVMRTGQPILDLEEYVVWPDERVMWVSTTKVPLRDHEGQIIGIFGISRDITERKHAEEKLQKAKTELEAANKELESFSYSVSHDLRAPLRAIHGYTNILVEDYGSALDEGGKRICGVISQETRRMGMLIDDLLAFSRVSRREVAPQKIDMKVLVDSVLGDLLKDEDRSRIDIHIGRLHAVTGDATLMRQVWVNLLSNAIKFTSRKKRAVIELASSQGRGEVVYSVRDNGAGFEMEYANKLFGVFQRLHGESEFEGTGVGLAIVQRVIQRHGGRVWAEGKVEDGATFHFALPRRKE